MRKQFNLQYYLDHPDAKVVTRDGKNVRILCTDTKSTQGFVITALLDYGNMEIPLTYDPLGVHGTTHELDIDLFFNLPDPEKKKVPLTYEDLLQRIKDGKTMWVIDDHDYAFNIVDFDDNAAYYVYGKGKEVFSALYEWLFGGCMKFADGTPCWKEVDE